MKKKETKKQNDNDKRTKQRMEDIEELIHAEWIAKRKAKASRMIALAAREHAQAETRRVATLGRWAPVADALEVFVHTTFDVADETVLDAPRDFDKVERVRDFVIARLRGEKCDTPSLGDVTFTIDRIAKLIAEDFQLGIGVMPDTLLAALTASGALSQAFTRL